MPRSLNLAAAMLESIAAAAARSGRTFSDQAAHWLLIGRAIDESTGFNFSKVEAALVSKRDTADLSETERVVWNAYVQDYLIAPDDAEEAFFEARPAMGLGVGLDVDGRIVSQAKQTPDEGEGGSG